MDDDELPTLFRCNKFIGRENTRAKAKAILLSNYHRYPYGVWDISKRDKDGNSIYEVWVETCRSHYIFPPISGKDKKVYPNQDIKDELLNKGIALKSWERGDEPIPSPYRKKKTTSKPKRTTKKKVVKKCRCK